jgi:signal transduction histidine kinase
LNFFKKFGLRLRLTLLFVFIFTGSLAVFDYFLLNEYSGIRNAEFDANLYNYAIDVAESLDVDSYGEVEFDPGIIKLNEKIFPFALPASYISVLDINGKVVAHSQNFKLEGNSILNEANLFRVLKKGASYENRISTDGTTHRVINYLLPVLKIDTPLILQISVPKTSIEVSILKLRKFLVTSLGFILFSSCFVGYAFIGKALKPMIEITKKTNQIEVRNLSERVPVPDSKDEIHHLAMTINHLLERLDQAFLIQERFVQNASHQLKTPLAIIKGELELFKSGQKNAIELSQFLESMSQEINSLVKLTNDLLILARVENEGIQISKEKISLIEVLLNQISRLSKLANINKQNIELNIDSLLKIDHQELLVEGDPDLLGVLFFNLIENALKYSPSGGIIKIGAHYLNHQMTIFIEDSGIGINPGSEEKIFDRFFRQDQGNQSIPGSGLGLAICQAVARLHNAKVWAQRNEKVGSTFYFQINNINKENT